jgi:hypothetical protein
MKIKSKLSIFTLLMVMPLAISTSIYAASSPDCITWIIKHSPSRLTNKAKVTKTSTKKVYSKETIDRWRAWNFAESQRWLAKFQMSCGDMIPIQTAESNDSQLILSDLSEDIYNVALVDNSTTSTFDDTSILMHNSDSSDGSSSIPPGGDDYSYVAPNPPLFGGVSTIIPNQPIAPTPEPSSYLLSLTGIMIFGFMILKQKKFRNNL